MSGTLELSESGNGFLRSPRSNYRVQSDDVAVPSDLCARFRLRGGDTLVGTAGAARGRGRRRGSSRRELATLERVNGGEPDAHLDRAPFEDLTAIDPDRRIRFATPGGPASMRVVDLLTPVGFGQRGLICAPPRTGKTVLLQHMADGIADNHPDVDLMVLLVDERPEEVTHMRRGVRGHVVYSSNDSDAPNHIRIARLVIQIARRKVEAGRDVVILLDSLTRLGRAFNAALRGGGRIMSGGIDARALTEPKSIFGAARNVEGGASLTIIATALIDTGSRMDEVIFNEFKGTGNMEIMLSRELADQRIWPAIHLNESGTRKEEKLLDDAELSAAGAVRRVLQPRGVVGSMRALLDTMGKYDDPRAFVEAMHASAAGLA